MSYENRISVKEVGREHSMVAERKRLKALGASPREVAIVSREAAMPSMSEARRRKPTGSEWKPAWMK